MYYISVHTSTYRYVPVCTAINQVYRIPDVPFPLSWWWERGARLAAQPQ
jgi:hypothetical protein